MSIQRTVTEAYDRGREQARRAAASDCAKLIANTFGWARNSYWGAEELDLKQALLEFSKERMSSDLDLTKYPECRGLREVVESERQGFADVVGDPLVAAYCFDWVWFRTRRLATRYIGKQPPPAQCTDFWFAETKEGGPIHGSNRDDVLRNHTGQNFRKRNIARGRRKKLRFSKVTRIGAVSSAVLCDEEPACLFPVDLDLVIPDGLVDLKEQIGYLERYRDFWGPGNVLWTDPQMNFAAIEKANVRMGVRYSTGSCAITAGAYLTPELKAFKAERDTASFLARGWSLTDNPDRSYWDGCAIRYRRLLDLVDQEYHRGATLLGAARIALDHSVPFPARICIAGERSHRDEQMQNWTLESGAHCIAGPNLRSYDWFVDPDHPRPIYQTECFIYTGKDNAARLPEWKAEILAAGEIGSQDIVKS